MSKTKNRVSEGKTEHKSREANQEQNERVIIDQDDRKLFSFSGFFVPDSLTLLPILHLPFFNRSINSIFISSTFSYK
ncbi:hypothetical protein KUA11_17170, partial [Acetobacter estunensis]